MPKLILKSPYIKSGDKQNADGYVRYIATREGVEKISESRRNLPATKKQRELIAQMTNAIPDLLDLFEYEDYIASPTREHASELITIAMELSPELIQHSEIYVKYIATRPGSVSHGVHGLFSDEKNPSLEEFQKQVLEHEGNVWTHIFSLRREDAERLGFDKAEAWRDLLLTHRNTIANAMKIPPKDFRWCAAYHDAGHHPHVHMVAYSESPKDGYLTRKGIQEIKSAIAREIFRQDLVAIYERKTESRGNVTEQAGETLDNLITKLQSGTHENPAVERLLSELATELSNTSGKKNYGYLKPPLKQLVDRIVDELARAPVVAACYEKWWELQCEILNTYIDTMPGLLPLSKQKGFRSIKNMVIQEAMGLVGISSGVDTILEEDDLEIEWDGVSDISEDLQPVSNDIFYNEKQAFHIAWSEDYLLAKQFLYGSDDEEQDFNRALVLFEKEAQSGNALAMHDLARMIGDGLGCESDPVQAWKWYGNALKAFLALEGTKESAYLEYRIGKMAATGLGTEQSYEEAAKWFQKASDKDHKYALYSLAGLFHRGQGVAQDIQRAFELYERSALKEFPYAHYELAKMLQKGEGIQKDADHAKEHFRKAFLGFCDLERQGRDDKLQYRLGWMLLTGTGTEKNESEAREYFVKAAKLGNPHAQFQLARIYLSDKDAEPYQIMDAVRWLGQAAMDGNPAAQYQMAKLYRDGMHVEKDISKAIKLFQSAADQNNDYSAYALGKLYLDGEELPMDMGKALHWLTNAGEQNNQYAQYRLGKLFLEGEAVSKNVDVSLRWLTASAEQDNQFAQYILGKLYLIGKDLPTDKEAARAYFAAAATKGNIYAQYFLDHMDELPNPSLALAFTRFMHHLGNIFREKSALSAAPGGQQTDRKLKQKLQAKKAAQGHARDDHEQSYY
ncbi:MAG: hypothetical protein EOM59_06425 [Clostridia bacterium]|nr:hypothetical protein [Clostridia bacterium]